MKVRHIALIPAAGTGSRMGGNLPKQYQLLAGQPVLWHTLSVLAAEPRLDVLAVVLHPGDVLKVPVEMEPFHGEPFDPEPRWR